MDVLSHGLWGGISFGRKSRRSFWLAFLFGVLPDVIPFGPFFAAVFLGFYERPSFTFGGHPPEYLMPPFVHYLYQWTHSLLIFTAVFAFVWLLLHRPVYELLAWPLHIVFDIFTHTESFFPTPFLWPLSNYHVSFINWSDPRIFIPNVTALAALYVLFFLTRFRRRRGVKSPPG